MIELFGLCAGHFLLIIRANIFARQSTCLWIQNPVLSHRVAAVGIKKYSQALQRKTL
ncbi:MAG: hypothetical protein OFPI_11100 [Osedax symbiont Rs2]|nr:MAG: hypothetical protein OFPI_11100 [Osedax symbiont Rs2]